jgi:transposase InsO family protein
VKYAVIQANSERFAVRMMCGILDVSRAGYYAWRSREESAHAIRDRDLAAKVRAVYDDSRRAYGSPRVFLELRKRGERCGRKRVARLMNAHGLVGAKRRISKRSTSAGPQHENASPNLIARQFDPNAYKLNQVWTGDFTEVPAGDGVLYLAVVLDLRSREIVGWSMRATRDAIMLIDALQMAVHSRDAKPGLIFHSDQGSQYSSKPFRDTLAKHHFIQSMSRKGNCWDNAPVESFFASMKAEVPEIRRCKSRAIARAAIFEYLAVFYNRRRIHTSIGNQVPAAVDREAA